MADIPGAVGYVSPGMIVQTADHDGRALATGQEGLLRFRGPRCVDGYVGNPPGSEMFFRDGWFYPGDIGRVTEHGMMVVSGREKNIIDLGGHKISPDTVEAALMSYPGVSFAAGVRRAECARHRGGVGGSNRRCRARFECDARTLRAAGCRPGRRRPGSSRWRISHAWPSAGSIAESFRK